MIRLDYIQDNLINDIESRKVDSIYNISNSNMALKRETPKNKYIEIKTKIDKNGVNFEKVLHKSLDDLSSQNNERKK